MNLPQQVDCEFKYRYFLGAHIHIRIFVRECGQSTWKNCGTITIATSEWFDFRRVVLANVQGEEAKNLNFDS